MTTLDVSTKASPMNNTTPKKSLLAFFLLAIILITPFWVLGAITGIQLLPGIPIAALGTLCPMTAALILVYRERKLAGVIALLKRSFDYKRIKDNRWYVPILLIMAGAMVLSFVVSRLMGVPVPLPHITILSVLVLGLGFFSGHWARSWDGRDMPWIPCRLAGAR